MRSQSEVQSFLKKEANRMIQRPTAQEQLLKDRLDHAGIRYQFQSIKFSKGTYRIFDFYLSKRRIVIEIDGLCHDLQYDAKRDKQLHLHHKRLIILRFTNSEIETNLDKCIEIIQRVIDKRKSPN